MKSYTKSLSAAVDASRILSSSPADRKNAVLAGLSGLIRRRIADILVANDADVREAKKAGCDAAFINRLTLTEQSVAMMAQGVTEIAALPDPVGKVLEERVLANGVCLKKRTVPLGVLAVIYESRPNVTIDAAALAFKAGSAIVLKGGSEVIRTNRVLIDLFHQALRMHDMPEAGVLFLDTTDRTVVSWLLKQEHSIDVVIPRGGYGLVRAVVEQSRIPVLYHAAGGARIYVDQSADVDMAVDICVNAKTSRPATCNSLDTIVVHEAVAKEFVARVTEELKRHGVEVVEDDWSTEFLSLKVSVKIVKDTDEGIAFIRQYTKRHTEGIVATDQNVIDLFVSSIDAAAVMINCSTRLHDGGTFGLGAEMGIATGKLHARGPVGLNELVTYQWVATGNGQIRK